MCAECRGTGSIYESDPVPNRKPKGSSPKPKGPGRKIEGLGRKPEEPNRKPEEADSRALVITTVLVFLVTTGYLVNDGMEWGSALLSGFFIGMIGGYLWKLVWGVIVFAAVVWVYGTFF
jgi:hypothetical protein